MVELKRTTRFAINPPGAHDLAGANTYAGAPSMVGLGRHYEVDVAVRQEPDPVTGYAVDIHAIDTAVRQLVVPRIARACDQSPLLEPASFLATLVEDITKQIGLGVHLVRWRLTPTYSVEMERQRMDTVVIRQRFEFAASHRLHAPSISDEENLRLFGKCNNPAGHGHNYWLEPAVEVDVKTASAGDFCLAHIEHLTREFVLNRFDHKHLNTDLPEFQNTNPSVENIAKAVFELLAPAITRESDDRARLASITVWETEKTSCMYPAPSA